MDVAQVKQLSMKDVLAILGCQPHHEAKGAIWYITPLARRVSNPSKLIWSAIWLFFWL